MPEKEIAARGGAKKWRTITLGDGRKVRVAIVKKAGPRGGHTVAGPKPVAGGPEDMRNAMKKKGK